MYLRLWCHEPSYMQQLPRLCGLTAVGQANAKDDRFSVVDEHTTANQGAG